MNIEDLIPTLKIHSVSRISLDLELRKQFKKLKKGAVLDTGAKYSPYKKYIPFTEYLTLDIEKDYQPDICSDLHDIKWQSEYFDTVLAIEVLHYLYNPQKAINEMFRVLKPGGKLIMSVRFILPYDVREKDYYRFTPDSLSYLLRKFKQVEICHHGNKLQVIWRLLEDRKLKVLLNVFNPFFARIRVKKTRTPLGFVVLAEK